MEETHPRPRGEVGLEKTALVVLSHGLGRMLLSVCVHPDAMPQSLSVDIAQRLSGTLDHYTDVVTTGIPGVDTSDTQCGPSAIPIPILITTSRIWRASRRISTLHCEGSIRCHSSRRSNTPRTHCA